MTQQVFIELDIDDFCLYRRWHFETIPNAGDRVAIHLGNYEYDQDVILREFHPPAVIIVLERLDPEDINAVDVDGLIKSLIESGEWCEDWADCK